MPETVAILGANGFVGFRTFERWTRSGQFRPRAVVRRPGSLAQIARYRADWCLADATDAAAMVRAFEGCTAVVHCVVGDERVIKATTLPVLSACEQAGVKRLVFLSSASVHGQNPAPGTNEDSPLSDHQKLWYNNAKVEAERLLLSAAARSPVELVLLRPGIVWGPRSYWVAELLASLEKGRAAWLHNGEGICNSIFVDNLIHAVEQALIKPAIDGECFLLNDPQEVRWRDLYLPLASALGYGPDAITEGVGTAPPTPGFKDRLSALKSTAPAQSVLKATPANLKEAAKGALRAFNAPPKPNPFAFPPRAEGPVALSAEMTLLFSCSYRLPYDKATRLLDYAPPVTLEAGLTETIKWIHQVGYAPNNTGSPR